MALKFFDFRGLVWREEQVVAGNEILEFHRGV